MSAESVNGSNFDSWFKMCLPIVSKQSYELWVLLACTFQYTTQTFCWNTCKMRMSQGCSHAFDMGGGQAYKVIFLVLFVLKVGGPNPTFTLF